MRGPLPMGTEAIRVSQQRNPIKRKDREQASIQPQNL